MTLPMQFVLSAFLEAPTQELYGIEIADAAELPSATVHPILARLEGLGWLESRWEQIDPRQEGRSPRRYYKLTASGTQGAREALSPRVPPVPFAAQTLTRGGAAMTPRAVAPISRHIIEFAAQTLPSSRRDRYRHEFTAELHFIPRNEQLRFALRVLSRTWALRAAFNAPTPASVGEITLTKIAARPLHCRLHLWHHWRTCHTEDGHRYKACARCGREIARSSWGFQTDS
jgi:Transcriptional regulator PadR-like family.